MESKKRTVEDAVDVYLDRLAVSLEDADRLTDAKDRALTVAVTWLDDRGDRSPRLKARSLLG